MMLAYLIFSVLLLPALSVAQTRSIDINRYPPQPQATTCGDIVNESLYNEEYFFYASEVFECLTSVPFNNAVATLFIQYLNETFQFHATTAYIRNPPPSYQQPPFDFFGALDAIGNRVKTGVYHNQYAFETDVQSTIRGLHDTHAFVEAGVSSQFTFLSPFRLVSVSLDGKQAPKLYVYDDLISQFQGHTDNVSAISTINGEDAIDYMKAFAVQQSFGMVEPNADWNQLMVSPAQEIFGSSSFSDAAPFYAGDQMTLTFEDNSDPVTGRWEAVYASPGFTSPLETGGDFYNFFVLGLYPESYDTAFAAYQRNQTTNDISAAPTLSPGDDTDNTTSTSWHNSSPAYPADTMNHQQDLGMFSDGDLTGYYIPEISTAILSLPSFSQYGDGIETFDQSVADFIGNATQRNAQKIIIDLQQNDGGLVPLALDVFDKFFTNIRPFAGSRMRSQPYANVLGENDNRDGSEWVVTDRIDARTGHNFTSWSQYYGPMHYNGDDFSLIQEYDLSSPDFVEAAFEVDMAPCYYNQSCPTTPGWHPADIVLLTDGICGSTCSLFVEMMREQGVRSVAIGGLPESGPMQAACGSRGAAAYSGEEVWDDFSSIGNFNSTAAVSLPSTPPNTGITGVYTGFTLRDQMQRNESTPNQVLYMPADCRLYWTFANFYNYTRLWQDVHDAMFTERNLCVAGSREAVTPQPANHSTQSTSSAMSDYIAHGLIASWSDTTTPTNGTYLLPGVWDGNEETPFLQFCTLPQPSNRANECDPGKPQCYDMDFVCAPCVGEACRPNSATPKKFSLCSKRCFNDNDNSCGAPSQCKETSWIPSKNNLKGATGTRQTLGFCEPVWTDNNRKKACAVISRQNLADMIEGP